VRNGFFLDLPGRHYRIASRCFERGDLKAYSEVDSRHLSGGSEAPENLVIGIARVRFPSIKRNFKIHGNQASERSDGNGRAGLVLPEYVIPPVFAVRPRMRVNASERDIHRLICRQREVGLDAPAQMPTHDTGHLSHSKDCAKLPRANAVEEAWLIRKRPANGKISAMRLA
jgi:hypothetical protein